MAQGVRGNSPQVAQPPSALRVVRAARGFTQGELAERAGLARPTISRLENAHEKPQHSTAQRLASALGWNAGELFPQPTEDGPE